MWRAAEGAVHVDKMRLTFLLAHDSLLITSFVSNLSFGPRAARPRPWRHRRDVRGPRGH